jgi:hypothetical protein
MPFGAELDDVYSSIRMAVKEAAGDADLQSVRLDEIRAAGRITDDLVDEINSSHLCIADITGSNPNVMWEVGYAMARKKPVLFLAQAVKQLPFDIRDMRVIEYSSESLAGTLVQPLAAAIRQTLSRTAAQSKNPIRYLCGDWFGYYYILRDNADFLGRERYELGVRDDHFLDVTVTSQSFDQQYSGDMFAEDGFIIMSIQPSNHNERIFVRFKKPIPGNDKTICGVWSALDFDTKVAAGPMILSRNELNENTLEDLKRARFESAAYTLRVT